MAEKREQLGEHHIQGAAQRLRVEPLGDVLANFRQRIEGAVDGQGLATVEALHQVREEGGPAFEFGPRATRNNSRDELVVEANVRIAQAGKKENDR